MLPGITAPLAKESHTFGTQWFQVQTRNGPFAVVGDTVYWYSNIERMWPPGYSQGNTFNQIRAYREIRELLKNKFERLVPSHDPQIWDRHSSWTAPSGNQIAEVNLRQGDTSRRPDVSAQRSSTPDVSAAWMVVTTPRYRISRNVGGEPLLLPSPSPMFGYKNHIGIDRAHGLIRTWDANAANANEPRPLANRPET